MKNILFDVFTILFLLAGLTLAVAAPTQSSQIDLTALDRAIEN